MRLAGGQIAKDLLYSNLPCHTLLYFVHMVYVCSITYQPVTWFSVFVGLERMENNSTISTIWLNIWGLLLKHKGSFVFLFTTTPWSQTLTHPRLTLPVVGTHLMQLGGSLASLGSLKLPQHYFLNKELFKHQKVKTWLWEPYQILLLITKFCSIY